MVLVVLLLNVARVAAAAPIETIAHRGYTCNATDNTLESVRSAWQVTVDAVELDVQVSRDNIVYLFHDDVLSGVKVANMTYDSVQTNTSFHVPTLRELFALQPAAVNGGYFLLDLKFTDTAQLQILAEVIRRSGVSLERVVLQSGSALALRDLRRRLPDVRLMYLSRLKRQPPFFLAPKARAIIKEARYAGADGVSLKGRRFIDKDFVQELQRSGLTVNFWTINNLESMRFYQEVGVDGLITDLPIQLRRLLGNEVAMSERCSAGVSTR